MWLWPWGKGKKSENRDELSALLTHVVQHHHLAKFAAELVAHSAATIDPTLGSPQKCGVKMLRLIQQLNVRGHRLWDFYCYVAHEDLRTFVLILRAYQLGLVTRPQIDAAIDNDQRPLDLTRIVRAVEELVPELKIKRRERKGSERPFGIDWTGRGGR